MNLLKGIEMGNYLLAAFLIIYGLGLLIGLNIPEWVLGLLSTGAGILILVGR